MFYLLFYHLHHHKNRCSEKHAENDVSKNVLPVLFPVPSELVTARSLFYFDPLSVFDPDLLLLSSAR